MAVKIDTKTGLPELPDGYVWRVKDEYVDGAAQFPALVVELCREGKTLFRRKPVLRVVELRWAEIPENPVKVKHVIRIMAVNIFTYVFPYEAAAKVLDNYVGVYPPKKLD